MKYEILAVVALVLMTGCTSNDPQPVVQKKIQAPVVQAPKAKVTRAVKPKEELKLKTVEDTNFDSDYMYPENKVPSKKVATSTAAENNTMSKEECVQMIGQEKFDKYTQMFGNEASSIKRCKMLKTMKS